MSKRDAQEPDRAGIVATLGRWSRGRVVPPAERRQVLRGAEPEEPEINDHLAGRGGAQGAARDLS